jgi:hypothetical protein
MVKNSETSEPNFTYIRTQMKTQSSAILLIDVSPLIKVRAALEWRKIVPILTFLGLCLILGPLSALAKPHRASEWQRSLILPPPNEPPPPPPPGEDLLLDYADNSVGLGETNLCNSIAQAECGNVLELPRSVFAERHRLLAVNHEYKANRHINHERPRRDYSEGDIDEWPLEDGPPTHYERDLKLPPADHAPLEHSTGGFIPLNPRGITVRPGERSPFPPTSPLLTTPPGAAAMPYVWRP